MDPPRAAQRRQAGLRILALAVLLPLARPGQTFALPLRSQEVG